MLRACHGTESLLRVLDPLGDAKVTKFDPPGGSCDDKDILSIINEIQAEARWQKRLSPEA